MTRDKLPLPLVGDYHVRVLPAAFADVAKLMPRRSDRAALRRHTLVLRYFPEKSPVNQAGRPENLDWSWIKALAGRRVGELRIREHIATYVNLRVIFYVPTDNNNLPEIWVLAVFDKKRDDFTKGQIATFHSRRDTADLVRQVPRE